MTRAQTDKVRRDITEGRTMFHACLVKDLLDEIDRLARILAVRDQEAAERALIERLT